MTLALLVVLQCAILGGRPCTGSLALLCNSVPVTGGCPYALSPMCPLDVPGLEQVLAPTLGVSLGPFSQPLLAETLYPISELVPPKFRKNLPEPPRGLGRRS